ncbi:MAG TPA: hypothetical protein VFA71_02350 [Terriglobales bacterium]|nr:hypothetical protein [Terriglobales bacterium]
MAEVELEVLQAVVRDKCAYASGRRDKGWFWVNDEIGKKHGRVPKLPAREPQISWRRFFSSLDRIPSPEMKGLNPEETSFIEKYLKLADELLHVAASEQEKNKKTG